MLSKSLTLTAAALAAAAITAPSALADSIVYIDGGNVWSAEPDGSHKVQLTDGGSWHSPTQSDDGTVAAVQGTGPIVVMAGNGRPIRTITTPAAPSGNGGTFAPSPVSLSFSPDGSKIAYSYVNISCPVASSCGSRQVSTFYTRADVTEATPHSVWGNQFSVGNPEWVTNSRTLVFGGAGSQVSIDDLGPGDYSHTAWMTPTTDQGDGEVSRDGRRLATTFFYGDDTRIAFFDVTGDVRTELPPAQPEVVCTSGPDAYNADPTWSPDATAAAYQSRAGIEIVRFSAFAPGNCGVASEHVLTPTGSTPDWGPAAPPAARYTPPVAPPVTPTPPTGPHPGVGPGAPVAPPVTGVTPQPGPVGGSGTPSTRTAVKVSATRVQSLARGLKVRCTPKVATTCKATARFRIGQRIHKATGTAKARAGRAATVRLRVRGAAARALRAQLRTGRKVQMTITVTGAGGSGKTTIQVRR